MSDELQGGALRNNYSVAVRRWGVLVAAQIRALGPRRTGQFFRTLRSKIRSQYGVPNAVFFQFPRYAVWLEKGASRGFGGKKGSRWYTPEGEVRRTKRSSLGRMGTGRRPAHPLINPVLDKNVEQLADIAAEYYGSAAVDAMRIK